MQSNCLHDLVVSLPVIFPSFPSQNYCTTTMYYRSHTRRGNQRSRTNSVIAAKGTSFSNGSGCYIVQRNGNNMSKKMA